MENFVLTFIAENSTEIISASSAIFGVILGWILQYITRRGRIKFLSTESKMSYWVSNDSGGLKKVKSIHDTQEVSLSVTLDLYNSSAYNKNVIRSIRLIIKENRSFMSYIGLSFSKRNVHEIEFIDQDYLSLNPQEYKEVHLNAYIKVAQAKVIDKENLYIQYVSVKNKKRYVKLSEPANIPIDSSN